MRLLIVTVVGAVVLGLASYTLRPKPYTACGCNPCTCDPCYCAPAGE